MAQQQGQDAGAGAVQDSPFGGTSLEQAIRSVVAQELQQMLGSLGGGMQTPTPGGAAPKGGAAAASGLTGMPWGQGASGGSQGAADGQGIQGAGGGGAPFPLRKPGQQAIAALIAARRQGDGQGGQASGQSGGGGGQGQNEHGQNGQGAQQGGGQGEAGPGRGRGQERQGPNPGQGAEGGTRLAVGARRIAGRLLGSGGGTAPRGGGRTGGMARAGGGAGPSPAQQEPPEGGANLSAGTGDAMIADGMALLAQAQEAFTEELRQNLQKLRQVIGESQEIAKKMEAVLGEESGGGQGGGQSGA